MSGCRFRQGFLQFFRFCPCRPCRKALRMAYKDRSFYSTRLSVTNADKMERNGSLMQTTLESIDDTNSTPSASMYRMHPIHGHHHHHHAAGGAAGGGKQKPMHPLQHEPDSFDD
jgi:hypothetical protein